MRKFILVISVLILVACDSGPTSGFSLKVDGDKDSLVFRGAPIKVWVNLHGSSYVEGDVEWQIGQASIARRVSRYDTLDNGDGGTSVSLKADTVWLVWNQAPPMKINETENPEYEKDSTLSPMLSDTVFMDSIAAVVAGRGSDPLGVNVQNVLPDIDTVKMGGWIYAPYDSIVYLSAHPGEEVMFSFSISDAFDEDFRAQFRFPPELDIVPVLESDTAVQFRWKAPAQIGSDTLQLEVLDAGGFGKRVYYLMVRTYAETGCVWAATTDELVKISAEGDIVLRLNDNYIEPAGLSVNANRGRVWFSDRTRNQIWLYALDGTKVFTDSSRLNQPTQMAVDVQSGFVWVADLQAGAAGRLSRMDLSGADSVSVAYTVDGITGPVTALSVDQYEEDLVWFAAPEGDYIGRVVDGALDTTFSLTGMDRPEFLSWDASAEKLWVADSSSVRLLNRNGVEQARIEGFEKINGLAAGAGSVCIADARSNQIVRFKSSIQNSQSVDDGIIASGFQTPGGVSMNLGDGSCWVADRENGSVVRLGADGQENLRVEGLNRPLFTAVHQGVE